MGREVQGAGERKEAGELTTTTASTRLTREPKKKKKKITFRIGGN
jgi:hypothetical protein